MTQEINTMKNDNFTPDFRYIVSYTMLRTHLYRPIAMFESLLDAKNFIDNVRNKHTNVSYFIEDTKEDRRIRIRKASN